MNCLFRRGITLTLGIIWLSTTACDKLWGKQDDRDRSNGPLADSAPFCPDEIADDQASFAHGLNKGLDPVIEFTFVPEWGSSEDIHGRIVNVAPCDFGVLTFIRVEGNWWVKPYANTPLTTPRTSGTWSVDYTTGGIDEQATQIAVFLVPRDYDPPLVLGRSSIPQEVEEVAVAEAVVDRVRSPRMVQFSGFDWEVKSSVLRIGPGPNYFSDGAQNVWVDGQDRLHLAITRNSDRWLSAEVIGDRSFGYGTYWFELATPASVLDPNMVLGLFTWDTGAPQESYRELDIELSQWGVRGALNAQYVVQPYNRQGHLHRFDLDDSIAETTHVIHWRPDGVQFESFRGFCSPTDTCELLNAWTFEGQTFPRPGSENVRMNLWLFNGTGPLDGDGAEVVVRRFAYFP